MAKLFQIEDYFRITSRDFESEFRDASLHVELPPDDYGFWFRKFESEECSLFRRLILGETLLIEENTLSVALPDELLGDEEAVREMVTELFGTCGSSEHGICGGSVNESGSSERGICGDSSLESNVSSRELCESGALKRWGIFRSFPVHCNETLDILVEVVPESVNWNTVGRYVFIYFSIHVSLNGALPRLSTQELEQGFMLSDDNATQRGVYELILNPSGAERCSGTWDWCIIKKSSEESVRRQRFSLVFFTNYSLMRWSLFETIMKLAPRCFSEDLKNSIPCGYAYEWPREGAFDDGKQCSYYVISRDVIGYEDLALDATVGDCIVLYESVAEAFQKCIDKLLAEKKAALDGQCTINYDKKRYSFCFFDGMVDLYVQYIRNVPQEVDDLIEELTRRRAVSICMSEFIRRDMGYNESSTDRFDEALEEWAYRAMSADPLAYIGGDWTIINDLVNCLV